MSFILQTEPKTRCKCHAGIEMAMWHVVTNRLNLLDFGALGRGIALLVFVFTLSKIKFRISVYYMSEYLQTKFRGERVTIHGRRSEMFFFWISMILIVLVLVKCWVQLRHFSADQHETLATRKPEELHLRNVEKQVQYESTPQTRTPTHSITAGNITPSDMTKDITIHTPDGEFRREARLPPGRRNFNHFGQNLRFRYGQKGRKWVIFCNEIYR